MKISLTDEAKKNLMDEIRGSDKSQVRIVQQGFG
jgi:hypothetical protein